MTHNIMLNYAKENYRKMLWQEDNDRRYKFIAPGSVYSNALWDWDSWLTNVALRQFVSEDIREYERGCILNFLNAIDERGQIPSTMEPTFSKKNFADTCDTNIHKPCLAQHAAFLIKSDAGDAE